jgi:hypothetical protein
MFLLVAAKRWTHFCYVLGFIKHSPIFPHPPTHTVLALCSFLNDFSQELENVRNSQKSLLCLPAFPREKSQDKGDFSTQGGEHGNKVLKLGLMVFFMLNIFVGQ